MSVHPEEPIALVVDLGADVLGVFTGRAARDDDASDRDGVGEAGNMSAQRPHEPAALAATRAAIAARMGFAPESLHTMRQVHGRQIGVVTDSTPSGSQLRGVDGILTQLPGRPLAVMTADCVPVLLAVGTTVGALHVGRRGLVGGAVDAALDHLPAKSGPDERRAAIGPSIRGCCYEVPEQMADEISRDHPAARATTTWGTPSLDLPAAVAARLHIAGLQVQDVGECTACTPQRWFSHRISPDSGRGAGIVMRRVAA